LGCGAGERFDANRLRYGRVVIMTDADVDGAHIAALLMTFFYKELPELVRGGRVFLAQPPLYRLQAGGKSIYARDDADRERLLKREFKANQRVEVSRFKGLGEMPPASLKETTMDPRRRILPQGGAAAGGAGAHRGADGSPDGPAAGAAVQVHPGERVEARRG
jgi:topoisomerase-4 subunit B